VDGFRLEQGADLRSGDWVPPGWTVKLMPSTAVFGP
jgi:hypothetical protein